METQGSRNVRHSVEVRRKWRILLGVLSLAVGFALVSLASGNFLAIGSAPRSAVTSAVKSAVSAVKSAVVKRAARSTSNVAERSASSEPIGLTSGDLAGSCTESSAIELNFNATPIAEGNVVWFHSAMSVNGLGSEPATIFLNDAMISFSANGTNYRLPVADTAITFDPGVTAAATSFDAASNRWTTMVPAGLSGRAFVSGLAFPVPAGGLPGGIDSVTWSAAFSTDTPGVTGQWQWSAAVYTSFSTDYNVLGVKPVDAGPASKSADLRSKPDDSGVDVASQDFDSVGKPTGLEAFVTDGARGEGGSDFTGSFGSASQVTPCAKMAPDASGRSRGQLRTHTNLTDRSTLRTNGILVTTGFAITKTCPTAVAPNQPFNCSFTVTNKDPDFGVTNLSVVNTVPCDNPPFCTGGVSSAVVCHQNGSPDGTLGPAGSATQTCTGTVQETAPLCGATQKVYTDQVSASGTDGGINGPVSGSTTNSPKVFACSNTTGLAITKTCPSSPVAPGSQFTCSFTVTNLDPNNSVTSLSVTNTVPCPNPPFCSGGTTTTVVCTQGGSPDGTLGPKNSPTQTCAGSVNETAPACGATNAQFIDQVAATGTDVGTNSPVSASTTNFVVVQACTPTPTRTPTNTPTPTPTNTPVPVCEACAIGYPFNSATPGPFPFSPRTSVVFNESEVLRAFEPTSVCLTSFNGDTVKLWYNDEHALTLGIRQVVVKERHCQSAPFQLCTSNTVCAANSTPSTCGSTVSTPTDYPVSPLLTNPGNASPPATGSNILNPPGSDDQNGTDTNTCADAAGCGRPMWPVLFVTDITTDTNPLGGDWQYHNPIFNNPSDVYGTWKAAVKTIDRTASPATTVVTPDADPSQNNWSLGAGSDGVPGHCSKTTTAACTNGGGQCTGLIPSGQTCTLPTNQGYGAEVRWNLTGLRDKTNAPLVLGHTYRLEFMVHDGDQNKTGGDSGEACVNFQYRTSALGPNLAGLSDSGQKESLLAGLLRSLSEQTSRILLNLAW